MADFDNSRVLGFKPPFSNGMNALFGSPDGFTASGLAARVWALKQRQSQYGPRHAAYDLKKLRGKQIVRRIGQTGGRVGR